MGDEQLPPEYRGVCICGHTFSYHEPKGYCTKFGCGCRRWQKERTASEFPAVVEVPLL